MMQPALLIGFIVNLRQGLVAYAATENHVVFINELHNLFRACCRRD